MRLSCSPWDWDQIGIKVGTKHVIYEKFANLLQKKDNYVNRLKSHIWHVKMYFKDHNIMQTVDPIEMNFEGLKMQN